MAKVIFDQLQKYAIFEFIQPGKMFIVHSAPEIIYIKTTASAAINLLSGYEFSEIDFKQCKLICFDKGHRVILEQE